MLVNRGSLWQLKNDALLKLRKMGKSFMLPAHIYMWQQKLTRHGSKRAVFFPSRMNSGHAGDLRAISIAAELKKFGWRVIVVPVWLDLEQRMRVLRAEKPDVILLQQSVHLLNRPSLYPGYNTIFDVDDADYTAEPELVSSCARGATVSVVGNRHLAEVFRGYGAPDVQVMWTGTYIHSVPGAKPNETRDPVISWAHSAPSDYPMEAEFVRKVMLKIAESRSFIFRAYGNKPAWLEEYVRPMRAAGINVQIFGTSRYSKFVKSLGTIAIGLQPVLRDNPFSLGKSFGKLLAYMAANVAVVASDEVDHPLFFRHGETGMLVTTVDEWAEACLFLLNNPEERGRMVKAARADFLAQLTTHAVAAKMSAIMDRFVKR
jgi:glycosyltransferase involved in cell wall biosynthesis